MENQESGTIDAVSHLKEDTLLRFRVGPFRFSVPAVEVEGIIVPPHLTVIPLNPPHSKGVFLFHEHLASAISLRSKFGLPDHDDGNLGQLILGEVKTGLVGFWVDEVYETVDATELEWRSMPGFIPHTAFESFTVKDDEIVMATTMQILYDVPAEQMASMLASVRQNFDLPEDVPPVEAEGLAPGNATEDEDAFGDLIDASREAIRGDGPSESVSIPGSASRVAETAEAGNREVRPTVIEFPAKHDADDGSKQQEQPRTVADRGASTSRAAPGSGTQPGPRPNTSRHGSRVSASGAYDARRTVSDNRASAVQSRINPARESSGYSSGQPRRFSGGTYAGSINRFRQENRNTAYSPDEATSQRDDEKRSNNGTGWLLLALLLLLLGAGYWLWPTSKKDGASSVMPQQAATDTFTQTYEAPKQEVEPVDRSSGPSENDSVAPAESDRQPTVVAGNSTSSLEDNEVYRLEGKDVTVTVERNLPAQQETETEQAQSQSEAGNNEAQPQPGYREFVHIVVKGDTLWDIARKYLKNPFRYPELARLSQIKNPDLIYPGDTVRIRTRGE